MNTNKVLFLTIGIIVVLLLGAFIWWAVADNENQSANATVPIQDDFGNKIVYTTSADADVAPLRADCQARNGTFNECGSICASEDDVCADVCAFTCTDLTNNGNAADDDNDDDRAQQTDVQISQPQANEAISSPLTVTGQARGTWFFEGTLPIDITNQNGDIIAQGYATSSADWMTENYIPFSGTLTFSVSEQQSGEIIIKKANPSGLPEHGDEIHVPVILTPSEAVY